MTGVNIAKGLSQAVLDFLVVGVGFPFALEYFSPVFSGYVTLPPSSEVYDVFALLGSLMAVAGFLRNAFSKGQYPWLVGRIGGGLVEFGIFYFLFLDIPNSLASAGVESSGLVALAALAVVLSYGYLVLDFFDARRSSVLTTA